jgi:hypothetical protein
MSIPFFSSFRGSRSDAKPVTSPGIRLCMPGVRVSILLLAACSRLPSKTSKPTTPRSGKPWSMAPWPCQQVHGMAAERTSCLMSRDGELLVGSGFSILCAC